MRSLRERLAAFEPPPRLPRVAAERAPAEEAFAALVERGAVWVGTGERAHLRLERPVDAAVGAPWPTLPRAVWEMCATAVPAGDHWVVLDTETTGLESGTGTLVFLVGLLHWTPDGCRRVQLVLPEPASERGMLEAMRSELAGADALLSYNGRSFDVARLRARLYLQRMEVEFLERPHLDLIVPARRLLRGTLDDLRLTTIERVVLGRARQDDLPGEFAPEVYRTLLAEGRDTGLAEVALHNARDVDGLPALAAWIAATLLRAPGEEPVLDARIRLEVARLHAARGDRDRAREWLRSLADTVDRSTRRRARAELATMLRRDGDFEAAAAIWRAQFEESPTDVRARVEFAKLCEHRLQDLRSAHEAVAQALRLGAAMRMPSAAATAGDDLGHRLRRIRRKLDRGGDRV